MAVTHSTADDAYALRLATESRRGIRRWVDVQAPYRWNLRRLRLGRVLDVGCGIGRNLAHLDAGSVGIDHNRAAVEACRTAGLTAYLPDDFVRSPDDRPAGYDSLLLAHVVEHLSERDGVELLRRYLPQIRSGGRVVVIVPQQAGQRSDPTHVRFVDMAALWRLGAAGELMLLRAWSFPFPRLVGRVFAHNEHVAVYRRT